MLTDDRAKEVLSRNIGQRLVELEWTQGRLADESGETDMMISRIIRRENIPSAAVLARIAEALGVSTDFLLRDTPEKKSRKPA